MGTLLVVTGPPGAGKSTVARLLAEMQTPSALVEGDAFFGFLARGAIEPWRGEAHAQNTVVISASAAAAGYYASGPFFTVFDGVVGMWFLPQFAAMTGLSELHYAVVLPTVETCVDRVANRTGHGFRDEDATRQMHGEFAAAHVDSRHVFSGDDESPSDLAARIFTAWEQGALRITMRS